MNHNNEDEDNLIASRRAALKFGLGAVAGAITLAGLGKAVASSECGELTPAQTEGPFYPGENKFSNDADLTQIANRAKRAEGQVVYVAGQVIDNTTCAPVTGATVEIWQACASGRYNNPKDTNPAPLDPNFKFWGEAHTGADGKYMFKTIVPGAYPADTDWVRPPHIHFKISVLGYQELITQMYFAGQELNEKDLILHQIPKPLWPTVIVDFKPVGSDLESGALIGNFIIEIQKVRRS